MISFFYNIYNKVFGSYCTICNKQIKSNKSNKLCEECNEKNQKIMFIVLTHMIKYNNKSNK